MDGRDGGAGTDEPIKHRQGFTEPAAALHLAGEGCHRLPIARIGGQGPLPAGGRGVHPPGRGVELPEAAQRLDVAGECGDEGPLIAAVDPFRYEGGDRLLGRPRALRGAGERGEGEPAGPGELPGGHARGGVVEGDQARGRTARGRGGLVGAPWDSVV